MGKIKLRLLPGRNSFRKKIRSKVKAIGSQQLVGKFMISLFTFCQFGLLLA